MDVSKKLGEVDELLSLGSSLDERSFSTPETTETGISSYHVDEFTNLGLCRIFIVAHSATHIFNVSLTKDNDHMQVAFQRASRDMRSWGRLGLPAGLFNYQRGNFKDIIITIPL